MTKLNKKPLTFEFFLLNFNKKLAKIHMVNNNNTVLIIIIVDPFLKIVFIKLQNHYIHVNLFENLELQINTF